MSYALSFVGKDGPPCEMGLVTFGWMDATCDSWVKTELEPRSTEWWEHESVILSTEFKVHPDVTAAVNVTDVCTHVARVRGYPSDGVGYGWVSHLSRTMASISWAWVQMVNSLLQFIIPALCPSGTFLPWGWSDHGNSVYRLFCFFYLFYLNLLHMPTVSQAWHIGNWSLLRHTYFICSLGMQQFMFYWCI